SLGSNFFDFMQTSVLTWFPDGQSILFSGPDAANGAARFYRIDLKTREDLMKNRIAGRLPAVSPDGARIYYVKTEQATARLMAYDCEPGGELDFLEGQLPPFPAAKAVPARIEFSPEGSQIAFQIADKRAPPLTDPAAQATEPPILRVMPTSGGPVR